MNAHERQNVYRTSIRQLQAEQESHRQSRAERLEFAFGHRCGTCHDPDSDPVFDGADSIVCDICGERWR